MRAIGMMSGTSLDGIDIALIETDGEQVTGFGPVASFPYTDHQADRALIFRAMADAVGMTDRTERPGCLSAAEAAVTRLNSAALTSFIAGAKDWSAIPAEPITAEVVGFHGQTVVHRPDVGFTVQLGDGAALSWASALPVVADFRAADMRHGGQGAPLVPVYHRALVRGVDRPRPVAVLNLGGAANITYIADDHAEPIACDTGPANALIDDFVLERTGEPFDPDGRLAASGCVDDAVVTRLLGHPFFAEPPPKSLDRNSFRDWVSHHLDLDGTSVEDGAATLTAFTAASVHRVIAHLPKAPRSWIVTGGGARNATLMRMLAERLAPAGVEPGEAVGWSSDHIEAQAFAFLAVRALRGLPLSYPSTTGVREPVSGGIVHRPSDQAGT